MGICAGNWAVLFPSVFTGAAGLKLGESKGQKCNLRYDSLVDGQGSRRLQNGCDRPDSQGAGQENHHKWTKASGIF